MAKLTITVEFTLDRADIEDVYDDLYEGDTPENSGDAFKAIIETAMYDPDNSDVNLAGEFKIVNVQEG